VISVLYRDAINFTHSRRFSALMQDLLSRFGDSRRDAGENKLQFYRLITELLEERRQDEADYDGDRAADREPNEFCTDGRDGPSDRRRSHHAVLGYSDRTFDPSAGGATVRVAGSAQRT
jgi:hypothetical protein